MKFVVALLAAPIGYIVLSGYLFSKVRPLPITDMPDIRAAVAPPQILRFEGRLPAIVCYRAIRMTGGGHLQPPMPGCVAGSAGARSAVFGPQRREKVR